MSLEQEYKSYLDSHDIKYEDNSSSPNKNDFTINVGNDVFVDIEVKEKKQKYKDHWTDKIPQEHLFIIDDLAARRIILSTNFGYAVIKDVTRSLYFVISPLIFSLIPKIRVNRKLTGNVLKGKWLIDFRNTIKCSNLTEVAEFIKLDIGKLLIGAHTKEKECAYNFVGEEIPVRGTARTRWQSSHDMGTK